MALVSRFFVCAALAGAAFAPVDAFAATEPVGVWLNDTGRGAIEIKPCGNGLCGHVVWVEDHNDADGCGRQIIGDAIEVSRGVWDGGWIYSPERKRRYDVELTPLDPERLKVVGYAGSKLFSKSMVWTRAPADLKRCDAQQAAVSAGDAPSTPRAGASRVADLPPPADPVPAPRPAMRPASPSEPADRKNQPAGERQAEARTPKSQPGSDLPIDKYFTKLPNGDCVIDLPWVKVNFPCEKR